MNKLICFIAIFTVGELLVNPTLFAFLRRHFLQVPEQDVPPRLLGLPVSVFKGCLERFTLFLGLILPLYYLLTVFGTIKIGTRLEKNNKVQNDYFIIGNLFTILIAMLYSWVWSLFTQTAFLQD